MLVQDLLQLPPVHAAWIFNSPKNKHFAGFYKVNPVWRRFEPMILKHNPNNVGYNKRQQIRTLLDTLIERGGRGFRSSL